MTQTRGETNHNPGNLNFIHPPAVAWNGQIGLEIVPPGKTYVARFGLYDTDHHGIRALAKQLLADYARGNQTIALLAKVWAPAADNNDPDSYASNVGQFSGFDPDGPINLHDIAVLPHVVSGFIEEENGRCEYDPAVILAACQDALGLPMENPPQTV